MRLPMIGLILLCGCAPGPTKGSLMSDGAEETRRAADLAAIEELHRRDMAAARAGDAEALAALWSDDIVALAPGQPIRRGRENALADLRKSLAAGSAYETLEYQLDFEEVQVLGDYAYDWGTFRGTVRPQSGGDLIHSSGKLLRILQRAPDGSWRVHRTIWNVDPAPAK